MAQFKNNSQLLLISRSPEYSCGMCSTKVHSTNHPMQSLLEGSSFLTFWDRLQHILLSHSEHACPPATFSGYHLDKHGTNMNKQVSDLCAHVTWLTCKKRCVWACSVESAPRYLAVSVLRSKSCTTLPYGGEPVRRRHAGPTLVSWRFMTFHEDLWAGQT